MAGVQKLPNARPAANDERREQDSGTGQGRRRRRRPRQARKPASARNRPIRSETRPISGLMIASRPAVPSQSDADRDRGEPELLEPQRGEHAERSEEHRREEDEPDAEDDPAVPERPNEDG